MMPSPRTESLRKALEADPADHVMRQMYAESLQFDGLTEEALAQYERLLLDGHLSGAAMVEVGMFAFQSGRPALALQCVEMCQHAGYAEGVSELEQQLANRLEAMGISADKDDIDHPGQPNFRSTLEPAQSIRFSDVGGMDEVKKSIRNKIILPFEKPELFEKYNRKAGGAVLFYGPPGCGKTYIARATAGECGLPFFNIRIEDIVDPWFGMSEQKLHMAFEEARSMRPCVVFLDEFDALAFSRRKHATNTGRTIVDQILQELDAIGADNEGLLIMGATNAPWDVDDALKRPGRFGALVFVPPPDSISRQRIFEILLSQVPSTSVDINKLVSKTALYSGADLKSVIDAAIDSKIEKALETGQEEPVTTADLLSAVEEVQPSTLEWLASARNYAEFANQGNQYDDIERYLKSPEYKRSASARKIQ